jgi:RNA polymerase sigma-B factor
VSSQGLSEVETRELLRAYHERGDRAARDRLIEQHLPLVRALARRYAGRSEQLDDLIQVGSIGLIKASDRFDLDRGVELTTYAIPTIIGELKRHFRDRGWAVHVPRRLKELSLQLNQLVEELGGKLGRSPTVAELAAASEADEEEVIEALDIGHAYAALSLSSTRSETEELDPLGSLGAPEEGYDTSEDRTFLRSGFEALEPRERRIMHLRFYSGLTQSQIAEEVGISQMHVSRLIRRSLAKMRAGMDQQPRRVVSDGAA